MRTLASPPLRLLAVVIIVLQSVNVKPSFAGDIRRETTLATFNTGLMEGNIANLDSRSSILINQIITSEVDIFCLQEVWTTDIQRNIRRSLKPYYPYALSAIDLEKETLDTTTPACGVASGVDSYFGCRLQRCAGLPGLAYAACGVIRCLQEAANLPEPCIICLMYEMTTTEETQCRTSPASNYEKTYGLMLLSKKQLINPRVNPYINQSQIRGYLSASVAGVGDLICTHLSYSVSADLYYGPPIVYPFLYSSYAEQQRNEVVTLLNDVTSSGMNVPILLGDFNHGPAGPGNIQTEFPFYYGLMSAQGFFSPYVLKDGRCTFCTGNPFNSLYAADEIVDHIYITTDTLERVLLAKRIFDDVLPSLGTTVSDHYGVKVRLSDIREECNFIQKCRFHCVSEIKGFSPFQLDQRDVCID